MLFDHIDERDVMAKSILQFEEFAETNLGDFENQPRLVF